MSAREELERELAYPSDITVAKATEMLNAVLREHAHELAEKQRALLIVDPGISEAGLIDLIDPEVTE